MVGPSWVIFTVMGAREFAVHGRGIDAAGRVAMLGMSILLSGRGLGAMAGPLVAARWAGRSDHRLRLGILLGYLTIAFGYCVLGASRSVWMAAGCALLAHAGGSTVWVFSTTLLQFHTEDRFRGRVFSADLGLGQPYLCRHRISGWSFSRCGNLRSHGRHQHGCADAGSRSDSRDRATCRSVQAGT